MGKTASELVEEAKLERLRRMNNPDDLPTGPFTGRCANCGSSDLWDDATMYGCNCCEAIFSNLDPAPRIVENGTGHDLGPAY